MRSGRVDEASALAMRIGKDIKKRNKARLILLKVKGRTNVKSIWAAVWQLTGRTQESPAVEVVDALALNQYYASILTDQQYTSKRAKCVELIITEPRRRRQFHLPPCISDITQVSSLEILSITITGKMSVSEHVRSVTNSCAQTIHAIRILRSRGMDDAQLQLIYRAIVTAKLTYAYSSWWGFTSASDSVSKASYAVGTAMVSIQPTKLQ